MVGLVHRVPGLIAAARSLDFSPPVAGAHRYWRILFTELMNDARRVILNTVEWEVEGGQRYLGAGSGAEFTASSTGGTTVIGDKCIEWTPTNSTAAGGSTYWSSSTTGPGAWVQVDFGFGDERELRAVIMWPCNISTVYDNSNATFAHPKAWDVEYSDDGVVWTKAWDGSFDQWAFQAGAFSESPLFDGAPYDMPMQPGLPTFILDAANSFSDAGVTPATDGQPVAEVSNAGSYGDSAWDAFTQPLLANRPIYREGGQNGHPYLEFTRANQQFMDPIPWTQPSGTSALEPYVVAAMFDCERPGVGQSYALCGDGPFVKNSVHVMSAPRYEFTAGAYTRRTVNRFVTSPCVFVRGVPPGNTTSNVYNRLHELVNGEEPYAGSRTPTGVLDNSASMANTSMFGGVDGPSWFNGKIYELIILADHESTILRSKRLERYLMRKYGLASSPPVQPVFPPNQGAKPVDTYLPKTLVISGSAAGNSSSTNSDAVYCAPGSLSGAYAGSRNETNAARIARRNVRMSNVAARIYTNGRSTDSTIVSRNNGADGNQSIVIPPGGTGWFEDSTNYDDINLGDSYAWVRRTLGGGGALAPTLQSCVLENLDDDKTVTPFHLIGSTYNAAYSNNTQSAINAYRGLQNDFTTQSDLSGILWPEDGVFRALHVRVTTNNAVVDTTVTVQVAGSNTLLAVTIPAGVTGTFTNLVDEAPISVGESVNYNIVRGASTPGGLTIFDIKVEFEGERGVLFSSPGQASSNAAPPLYYVVPMGQCSTISPESGAHRSDVVMPFACRLDNLWVSSLNSPSTSGIIELVSIWKNGERTPLAVYGGDVDITTSNWSAMNTDNWVDFAPGDVMRVTVEHAQTDGQLPLGMWGCRIGALA